MRKHKAPQFEFRLANESFTLVSETTQDGARIEAEQTKAQQDRQEAYRKQMDIFKAELEREQTLV